jgi:hypothetical protein
MTLNVSQYIEPLLLVFMKIISNTRFRCPKSLCYAVKPCKLYFVGCLNVPMISMWMLFAKLCDIHGNVKAMWEMGEAVTPPHTWHDVHNPKVAIIIINTHFRTFHIIYMYSKLQWPCDICDKAFECRSWLARHRNAVHLNVRHECDICHHTYSRRDNLLAHVRTTHTEQVSLQPFNQPMWILDMVWSVNYLWIFW